MTTAISLTDTMQMDFNKSLLAYESDAILTELQNKVLTAIAGWDNLGRSLSACEMGWYNRLKDLNDYITTLLNTRYGCND